MKVRKPKLEFTDVQKYYAYGSPLKTYMYTALSLMFPGGERFFIRSVNAQKQHAKDKDLLQDIRLFAAQEAQHGILHDTFNQTLVDHGFDVEGFTKFFEGWAFDGLEKLVRDTLGTRGDRLSLAVTAAAEHFTATWGELIYTQPAMTDTMTDEGHALLSWHAAEELEHKSVTYNLMQEAGVSYPERIFAGWITAGLLFAFVTAGVVKFFAEDKDANLFTILKDVPKLVTEPHSLMRNGFRALMEYHRPNFHPDDNDNRWMADELLKRYEDMMQEVAV